MEAYEKMTIHDFDLSPQWTVNIPETDQEPAQWVSARPKCQWVMWLWIWWPVRAHEASLCEPHLQSLSHLLPPPTVLRTFRSGSLCHCWVNKQGWMMKCSDLLTSDTFHSKTCDATAFYIKCISYEQHFPFLSFGHRVNASLLKGKPNTQLIQPLDISVQPISSLEHDALCSTGACDKDNPLDDAVWHTTKSKADTGPACCLHLHPVCVCILI